MNAPASDKEQLEVLGKWWKENGSSIVIGVLLGLSALLGGKAWLSYQETQALNASNIYTQMMAQLNRNDVEKVRNGANELISNYSGTAYAPLAALVLAKLAVQEDQPDAAQAQLRWAMERAGLPEVQHTARIRLVRVLISQQQYAQAGELLAETGDAGAYAYLYAELEGDLAMAEGQAARAAQAYKRALDAMPPQSPAAGLINTKYENVAASYASNDAPTP